MSRLVQRLYDLTVWAAQPLLRRKLRRRGQAEPGYLHAIEERFGHYTAPGPEVDAPQGQPLVWIHAVSLGETRAAAILLCELRARAPAMRLLLTHGTATGRAAGAALLQAGDVQVWQPWDTPAATRRFYDHFQPDVGVLMETEIWPNLIRAGRRAGVPLALANARLSEKSWRRAQRGAALLRPAYAGLSAVWAQTEADAQHLYQAGAGHIAVLGNLKFDAVPAATAIAQGQTWRAQTARPVVMLASSREGEEAMLLEQIQAANATSVQWLIVPRHPQRFDEVAALIEGAGLSLSRRSAWDAAPVTADVWLGDSLGEMAAYYALADAALLGGSFAPLGGQNLIEAAACGCPVVMGPHTYNFDEAAQLAQQAGAAIRVEGSASAGMGQAAAAALALVGDTARHAAMTQVARAFAASQRGAAARMAEAVLALLPPSPIKLLNK